MKRLVISVVLVSVIMASSKPAKSNNFLLNLGPEQLVQRNGINISVSGYSVPSFVDWNNDGLKDLIIGQGPSPAKVRVYLNVGTQFAPMFSDYFYVKSNGVDLSVSASGCLGCFPRVDYWDDDDLKDLLLGRSDGKVYIYLNIGSDEDPTFDSGQRIRVGSGTNLDVGDRATPTTVDWDSDGRKDLVVGGKDGRIHLYINCGSNGAVPPSFDLSPSQGDYALLSSGWSLYAQGGRSSPVVLDLDGDGNKDILTGNTDGELLFYKNVGTDAEPTFSDDYLLVCSDGEPIDLSGSARSRHFVCDWTGDGYLDVLIGARDGKVHLYQSIGQPGDVDKDYDVDSTDFVLLASCWLEVGWENCDGADLNCDGIVDALDLQQLADNWLVGIE
jgi:hypothetical protein